MNAFTTAVSVLWRPNAYFGARHARTPEPHLYYWAVTTLPVLLREAWSLLARPADATLARAVWVLLWSSLVALVSLYAASAVLWAGLYFSDRRVALARLLRLTALSATPLLLGLHADVTFALWLWAGVLLAVALRRDLDVPLRWAIGGATAVDGGPFLVALAAWLFSLQAFRLPSSSMAPTLVAGDHVLVTGLAPGKSLPEAGDVIVFRHRSDVPSAAPEEFIKRVIALPGDRVESRQRQLSVNGRALRRCPVGYLDGEGGRLAVYVEFHEQRAYLVAFDLAREHTDFGPFVVPPGQVFVLGDNRDRSFDSSRWNGQRGQGVPAQQVDGVARFVWFPPGRARWLDGAPLAPDGARRFRAPIEQCLGGR